MTGEQMFWMAGAYAVLFGVLAVFSRATERRILGALAGGAVVGALYLAEIVAGIKAGLWRVSLPGSAGLMALFYAGNAISGAPIYLITWRVDRRFGGRGLAACLAIAAIIGPPRDYLIARTFPEWAVFSPGILPVLAVSAVYVSFVGVGHAVMRLISGPSVASPLRHDRIQSPHDTP